MGGSVIIMDPWCDDVAAIMMIWYPGMEGGNALAEVLFGDMGPSGKLPVSIPRSMDQLPAFEMNAKKARYDYYHGYFLADKMSSKMRYPFGFGLSYTSFSFDNLRVSSKNAGERDTVNVLVDVTNTGSMEGTEVVQLYSGYMNPSVERHCKDLRGFERIALAAGETKTVSFSLNIYDLAYYDPQKKQWVVDKIKYKIIAANSSDDKNALEVFIEVK